MGRTANLNLLVGLVRQSAREARRAKLEGTLSARRRRGFSPVPRATGDPKRGGVHLF